MARRRLAIGLLAVVLALSVAPDVSAAAPARTPLVVVVLAPYLRWADVTGGYAPYLEDLLETSAVGDLNVTSLAPGAGEASAENGALMLSAGTWTRFDASAGMTATGTGGAILYRGIAAQKDAQAGSGSGAVPGALGGAIEGAGGVTAAIGNADLGVSEGPVERRVSPAVIMAMDTSGSVPLGDVSPGLLARHRPPAGFGVLADERATGDAFTAVLADQRVRRGPALVVVDPGDLCRAEAAIVRTAGTRPLARVEAVRVLDAVIRRIRTSMPADAVMIVATPVAERSFRTVPGFGPIVVNGPGWSGLLSSNSTRRTGLVTAADLTATILAQLGVKPPATAIGSVMTPGGGTATRVERVAFLRSLDSTARSIDTVRPFVVDGYIALIVLVLGLAAVVLTMPTISRAWVRGLHLGLLLVMAVPAAGMLMFVPIRFPGTPGAAAALLGASTVLLWVLAVASHYSHRTTASVTFLALLAALTLAADQWLGAPLSYSALLGYSPIVGARFYGIGNEGAALLIGGLVTGIAVLLDRHASSPWVPVVRTWGFPLLALVAVLTAAAPFLGANIGVAIWGTFTVVLVWQRMNGRPTGWNTVLLSLAAAAAMVAALSGIDLVVPASVRTHVGKALAGAASPGAATFTSMLARKVAMNVGFLTGSAWTVLFLASVAALGWMRLRPRDAFRDMLVENPDFAGALSALLLGGLLAYFTEDSGIVVPALLLLFPTVTAVYLMLMRRVQEGEE